MVDRYADALRSLRAIWIDAGTRAEWFLDLGAEAFRVGFHRIGVRRGGQVRTLRGQARRHRLPATHWRWSGWRTASPVAPMPGGQPKIASAMIITMTRANGGANRNSNA